MKPRTHAPVTLTLSKRHTRPTVRRLLARIDGQIQIDKNRARSGYQITRNAMLREVALLEDLAAALRTATPTEARKTK